MWKVLPLNRFKPSTILLFWSLLLRKPFQQRYHRLKWHIDNIRIKANSIHPNFVTLDNIITYSSFVARYETAELFETTCFWPEIFITQTFDCQKLPYLTLFLWNIFSDNSGSTWDSVPLWYTKNSQVQCLIHYCKWKFIWQASSLSFLGLHLGLELDDHCRREKSISTKNKKCSVNLELICIFLPTYPINFKLPLAQSMWNFQCSQSFVLSDIWVFWLHRSSEPLWYCGDHCHWNGFWFS